MVNSTGYLLHLMVLKLISVALCFVGYLVGRTFLVRFIKRLSDHKDVQPGRAAFVMKMANIGIFMGFFSIAMLTVGIGYGEVSLFLSSIFAVVGIALFATWSILSNLTASLIIFFAFPYQVGHRIRVMDKDDDMSGRIEEISAFHVLIRRDNGDLITYPNNLILQKAVLRIDGPTASSAPTQSATDAAPSQSSAPAPSRLMTEEPRGRSQTSKSGLRFRRDSMKGS